MTETAVYVILFNKAYLFVEDIVYVFMSSHINGTRVPLEWYARIILVIRVYH